MRKICIRYKAPPKRTEFGWVLFCSEEPSPGLYLGPRLAGLLEISRPDAAWPAQTRLGLFMYHVRMNADRDVTGANHTYWRRPRA